jgi:hypothetical protein
MKLPIKILRLFAVIIITVSIILFSASLLLQDKVGDIILKSLNRNISTKLSAGSFRLSFLKRFPKASLELKNVLVHSSPNFNSDIFTGINTDTLLTARSVAVDFRITDILKENYRIERIGAKEGKINFYIDTAGFFNYDISSKEKSSTGNEFTIELERIDLTDIQAFYYNLATNLTIKGLIKNGRLKSRISGKDIDFTAVAEVEIDSFQLFNTRITKPILTDVDVVLQSSENGIHFKKGILGVENFDFELDGSVSPDNMLDLNITGRNIDLLKIRNYLPEKYLKVASKYDPSGILIVDCKIKGLLNRVSNPHIEINCLLNDGHIDYGRSDLTLKDLSFAGNFTNGSKNRPETSTVTIRDIKAKLGSSDYSGSFLLSGFDNPMATLFLRGKVFPEELKEFFDLQNISAAGGSVDLDLKLETGLKHTGKYTFADFVAMKPQANLVFNSFTIGFNNNKMNFDRINGNLAISDIVHATGFELTYNRQRIKIDGEFRNLLEWLAGMKVRMIATADVSFSRLIPEAFIREASPSGTATPHKKAFSLPGDVVLDINFRIDTLDYKTFSSSKIVGSLNYKPRLLTFESMNMHSLSGIISGNGFIVQNSNKAVVGRGNFNVSDINVNKAFTTFHNFGQDFLKAENIAGTLSGNLSLLLPMDSMLTPQIKSLTAEGKFLLLNGALINFDPVKELSSFIELSELENISFQRLENDFFIRNNFLFIPQMDVKSSAVDLSVNGEHSFNNDYEYHIKMLLSEILSKKRKKNRSPVTEFGVVEDDGLGRTSLLLKVENKGDDVKVSYDLKAAGSEIKNNIKSERQTLKSLLNQEYGWYKNDTATRQKPAEKTRFRITWEGTDSLNNITDTNVVKKQSIIKNLFKKK